MFNQYRQTRAPKSPFEQTQYEADLLFYATFPEARGAACNEGFEQSIYDIPNHIDYPTSHHEASQPLEYHIRHEVDIGSSSISARGPTHEQPYPPRLHFAYPEVLHHQQPYLPHHHSQPSYHPPSRPIDNEVSVYTPPEPLYQHQYSSQPTSQYIPQPHPIPAPSREPTHLVYQPLPIPPQINTNIHTTISDRRPETPTPDFRQLNRHMKPPTLHFSNNCQLGVMRLDRLSDRSDIDSPPELSPQLIRSHPTPSEPSPITPCSSSSPATEFLLKSAPSPSIGLSSLSKTTPEKKPPLACLFCRGRKIACGAPLPGIQKTCNQCRKRGLTCYYPTESRRGMRKKKPPSDDDPADAEAAATPKTKKKKKN